MNVAEPGDVPQQPGRERLGGIQPPVQPLLPAAKFFRGHAQGPEVRAATCADVPRQVGTVVEPAGRGQALVKRRPRHRQEHAEHDDRDLRRLQEFVLLVEDRHVVLVEADDHAGGDEQVV